MAKSERSYSPDWSTPTSIGVWGGTSPERGRLAWTLARRIDPDLFWLNVVEDPPSLQEGEEDVLRRVKDGHLIELRPVDLTPHDDLGNMATWFDRDDASPDDRVRAISDFMRLPDLARRILADRESMSSTGALVLANVDRTQTLNLYSGAEGAIRPLWEAINHFSMTVILTIEGTPRPNSKDVDYVLRIDAGGPARAGPPSVTCTQGPPPPTSGLFEVGLRLDLDAFLKHIEQS